MGASTSLDAAHLTVMPGDSASCTIHIRNSGAVVDQFTVDIVGDARTWTAPEAPAVNLMPGETADVVLHFQPPRDPSVHAGPTPFGVRVLSREDPAGSSVEESVINVEPFTNVQVELSPKTSNGRRKGRHQVVVDNLGNHPVGVDLAAYDDEERLRYRFEQQVLTVEPGTAAFVKLVVAPESAFLRGPDRRHPFAVSAVPENVPPLTANGTVVQRQLLPRSLLRIMVAALAAAAVLAVLWFTALKPSVESAAREAGEDAAAEKQQELEQQTEEAEDQAKEAEETAKEAEEKAEKSLQDGEDPSTPVTGPGGLDLTGGEAFDMRIDTETPQNGTDFATFDADDQIPEKKILVITDIFVQNAAGDSGLLELRRGEDTTLLDFGLNNFRDVDYHVLTGLVFPPGDRPVIAVNCITPAGQECTPAVTFSGRLVSVEEPQGQQTAN
jgi:hypothetical protein